MYFLFLDESGTPPKPNKATDKYLVIGGVIIPAGAWHSVAKEYKSIAAPARGEIKWKYFGTGNKENTISHLSRIEKDRLRMAIFNLLISIKFICCVTSIEAAYRMPTIINQDDVYHLTYKAVTERFQYFLQDVQRATGEPQKGVVVCDHRMSDDDKKLRKRHHELLESDEAFTSAYDNFVETIFFSPSEVTIGLQLADMVAGAIHRSFQYGEHRFLEAIKPGFRSSPTGNIDSYGLVRMPKGKFIAPTGRTTLL
jgi:hypothetical protein